MPERNQNLCNKKREKKLQNSHKRYKNISWDEKEKKKTEKKWLSTKKKIWNKKRLVEFWFQLLVVREDEY